MYIVKRAIHSACFPHPLPLSNHSLSRYFSNSKTSALAALAAVSAASAQSTITISGLVDFSAFTNTEITTQKATDAEVSTKTTATGAQNTFSTGQISVAGTEDLGGGLKASFVVNSDITGTKSFATRDTNVALAGNFGTVRIGRFVPSAALGYHALSGAATTAVGSMYGMSGSSSAAAARFGSLKAGSFERNDNVVQYTSPAFNGLTLNMNHGTSTSDASDLAGKLEATQTGFSVNYANGPLVVAAGMNTRDANAEVKAAVTVGAVAAIVESKANADLNWIGASYNLGAAQLFATNVNRKDVTTSAVGAVATTADINVTSMGVSVPMGAYTFAASTYFGKDKVAAGSADDAKLSGNQISARYALSKRTTAYALIGTNKIERDSGNTANTARKETISAIGLVHSF